MTHPYRDPPKRRRPLHHLIEAAAPFHVRETVAAAALVALVAAGASYCTGCSPRTPAQAEAAYTAELLRCVDQAHTLAESRACREGVNKRWGVRP